MANEEKTRGRPLGERIKEAAGALLEELAGMLTPEPALIPIPIRPSPRPQRPRRR